MKIIGTLLLLVVFCTTTITEQLPPYPPSGWRPEGPAFELPNLQRNLQFNQKQEIPQQDYSAVTPFALQNPSAFYGTAKIQATTSTLERSQRTQQEGFIQLTPKIHVKQPFRPVDEQSDIRNGLTYQQFLEQEMKSRHNSKISSFNNEYLPSSDNFPFPRDNIDVRGGSPQDDTEPLNRNGQFPNNPNTRTELIPDFPAYNPNITHVEDRGNRNTPQFTQNNIKLRGSGNYDNDHGTTMVSNERSSNKADVLDGNNNNDGEFGKKIRTRKVKVIRRNRKPSKDGEISQENVN